MYGPVLGDPPGLDEKSECKVGEQPEGSGCYAMQREQVKGILLHLELELS